MLAGKFRQRSYLALRAYNRRSEQSVHGKRGLRVIGIRYNRPTIKQPSLDLCENSYQEVVSLKALKIPSSVRNTQNSNQDSLNKFIYLKFL